MLRDDLRAKDGFTVVEGQIADYLLARLEGVASLSARAVAREVHTAPSSVVRLCQRLGFRGYQDFRQAWLEELRYLSSAFTGIDANHPFRAGDDAQSVVGSIGSLYLETIQDTLGLVSHDEVRAVSSALVEADSIVVVSMGAQGDIAADFADKMLHIGRVVLVEKAADHAYYLARALGPGDVLVAAAHKFKVNPYVATPSAPCSSTRASPRWSPPPRPAARASSSSASRSRPSRTRRRSSPSS